MALTLEEYVTEVAGDNAEVRDALLAAIGKDPKVAERVTGGYLKEKDYRTKTQQLAADKKIYDQKLAEYETNLQAADDQIAKLMDQVAKGTLDVATANGRLQAIKERYKLSDDDIPTNREVELTDKVGRDVTKGSNVDIDARLAKFKTDLLAELTPAISRITADAAATDIMWSDIDYEHQQLVGKRLTAREKTEAVKEFNKLIQSGDLARGTSFMDYWEQRYDIPQKRTEAHEKELKTKWQAEYEAEQTRKRSEAALDTVRGESRHTESLDGGSPLFKHRFAEHEQPGGGEGVKSPLASKPPAESHKPELVKSGADRAAENWVSRRAAGVPLGEKAKAS